MKYMPPIPDSISVLDSTFINSRVTMMRAIELMETAFRILSEKSAFIPPRIVMSTPDKSMSLFFKPAFMSQYNRMSIKILTQILDNKDPEVPTIKGMVMLLDMVTGYVLSLSDGQSITALRTGAASGIATSWLANPGASSLALFGCGAQGRTQVEAVLCVRPITKICLFDTSPEKAACLSQELSLRYNILCDINPDISALKSVDVICTATPGNKPLFHLADLKPGVHINAVGSYRPDMQELDPDIFGVCRVYLDDAPACLTESGDLLAPLGAGIISTDTVAGEIGELIGGTIAGRQDPAEITLFKTVGNAIQDFFIANDAYEKSLLLPDTQKIILND